MFEKYVDGQPIAVSIFEKAINENKLSHAYLIDINNYTEAYDLILTFVKAIVCKNKHDNIDESQNCDICRRIDLGNYTELKIIESEGTWIKKDQLLDLHQKFSMKGIEGNKRIYIIKEADKMNTQTSNSILKFLEEPSDDIIAILMTNNISKLLDTIVSRCQLIRLFGNDKKEMSTIEKFANIVVSEKLKRHDFIKNEKNVEFINNIISFIKQNESKKIKTIVGIKKIWHNYFNNKEKVEMAIDLMINFYYDVLLILCDKEILFFNNYEEKVENIAKFNDISCVLSKLDVLIEAKSILKFNLNLNLFIDKLIIDMGGGINECSGS